MMTRMADETLGLGVLNMTKNFMDLELVYREKNHRSLLFELPCFKLLKAERGDSIYRWSYIDDKRSHSGNPRPDSNANCQ